MVRIPDFGKKCSDNLQWFCGVVGIGFSKFAQQPFGRKARNRFRIQLHLQEWMYFPGNLYEKCGGGKTYEKDLAFECLQKIRFSYNLCVLLPIVLEFQEEWEPEGWLSHLPEGTGELGLLEHQVGLPPIVGTLLEIHGKQIAPPLK